MEVERKDIYDFLVKLDDEQLKMLILQSDKTGDSVEAVFVDVFDWGIDMLPSFK